MIKKVEIKNFQSHRKTELDFVPGVNVITGTSDSGKTAIIRALRWVIKNRPSGDKYRSNWGGDTEVKLIVDDGEVLRRRTKNSNEYVVNSNLLLKALKTEVPEEVDKLLRINDINLQGQLDSSFLLSETSGEVANHFNKIAHLEMIGTTIQRIKLSITHTGQSLEVKRNNLVSLRADLNGYAYLPEFEEKVETCESKIKAFNEFKEQMNILYNLIDNIGIQRRKIAKASKLLRFENSVNALLKKIKEKKEIKRSIFLLDNEIEDYRDTQDEILTLNRKITVQEKVDLILDMQVRLKRMKKEGIDLHTMIERIKESERVLKIKRIALRDKKANYIAAFPDVCPLCGNKVKTIKL